MSPIYDLIKDLIERPNYYIISLSYEAGYGDIIVRCTIECDKRGREFIIYKSAANEIDAINSARTLLHKVGQLGLKNLPQPKLEAQPYQKGYYREMVGASTEVEFKRMGDKYFLTDIREKDIDGYYTVETPYNVFDNPDMKLLENKFNGIDDMYYWDTISCLSGSRGKAIVRDGKVIKTRTEAIG